MVLALYGIACLYLYVLRLLVTLGGCQGDQCMARKVGELVLHACQMEEAVLQIKRLLDDVRAGLAWQLLAATVDEEWCLHYAKLRLGARLVEPD